MHGGLGKNLKTGGERRGYRNPSEMTPRKGMDVLQSPVHLGERMLDKLLKFFAFFGWYEPAFADAMKETAAKFFLKRLGTTSIS